MRTSPCSSRWPEIQCVAQSSLKPMPSFMPRHPQCWSCRHAAPHLVSVLTFSLSLWPVYLFLSGSLSYCFGINFNYLCHYHNDKNHILGYPYIFDIFMQVKCIVIKFSLLLQYQGSNI